MTTNLPRLSECRDCHEPIRFVKVGRSALPVDPVPGDRGNVCALIIGGQLHGYVISKTRPWDPKYLRFMPHHATCEALGNRKKPAEDPGLFTVEPGSTVWFTNPADGPIQFSHVDPPTRTTEQKGTTR